MLAQCHRQWPSITSALGQCIVLPVFSGAGIKSVTRIMQQSETRYSHTMMFHWCAASKTVGQHWNRMNTTCLRKVYSRPSNELVLGQRRRRLTGIEPTIRCDAAPTLNWDLVGRHTSSVRGTSWASIAWMLASTGDGGGTNTRRRYIWTCLLGFFLNYILNIQDSGPWGKPIHCYVWKILSRFFVYCTKTD